MFNIAPEQHRPQHNPKTASILCGSERRKRGRVEGRLLPNGGDELSRFSANRSVIAANRNASG